MIVPSLSFGIALDLPRVGFSQADDSVVFIADDMDHAMKSFADISQGDPSTFTVTMAKILRRSGRIPFDIVGSGQRDVVLGDVRSLFVWIERYSWIYCMHIKSSSIGMLVTTSTQRNSA
jgi:hypothetical protein